MRTPRELYTKYRIMPSLQLHQLRVAAVAKIICDGYKTPLQKDTVILECLFHDMGNIVKSDLGRFPEFVQPEGREYWEAVKKDFMQTYGGEQHAAHAGIARDIGLPESVVAIMHATGYSKLRDIAADGSTELKICQYADLRAGPHGIVSLEERFRDFSERYASKDDAVQLENLNAGKQIEQELFSHVLFKPEDINDASVAPIVEELWDYSFDI